MGLSNVNAEYISEVYNLNLQAVMLGLIASMEEDV
jgi:hypothetical protein